jgi:hypothetical protein
VVSMQPEKFEDLLAEGRYFQTRRTECLCFDGTLCPDMDDILMLLWEDIR